MPVALELALDRLGACGDAETTSEALPDYLALAAENERTATIVAEGLLQGVFSPLACLRDPELEGPALFLDALLGTDDAPGLVASRYQEALLHRTRIANLLSLHRSAAGRVAGYEARLARGSDDSLPGRMRRIQALNNHYRELSGKTPVDSLLRTLEAVSSLPLSRPMLFVLVAHVAPLYRRSLYGAAVAQLVVANLSGWCDQLHALRSEWLDEQTAKARRADLPAEGTQAHRERAYATYLNQTLLSVVDEAGRAGDGSRGQPARPELPEIVVYEKAFSEIARFIADHALDAWLDAPEAATEILHLLSRLGAVRPRAMRILKPTLIDPCARRTEAVELAAVRFAGAFVTGFTRQQGWLQTRVVKADRGQELLSEIDALLEVDTTVRAALVAVSADPSRRARVRHLARLVLLRSAPEHTEREQLVAESAGGDEPLVLAFLDYVAETGAHASYEHVKAIYTSLGSYSDAVRSRCYDALEACGHKDTPALLRQEILGRSERAELVLTRMGAHGMLEQLRTERRVLDNVRESAQLEQHRAARDGDAVDARIEALHRIGESDVASIEATSLSTRGRITAAEFTLASADLTLRIAPLAQELQDALGSLPALQDDLERLLSSVDELRRRASDVRGQVDGAVHQIRQSEKDEAKCEHQIESKRNQQNALEAKLTRTRGEEARASAELHTAERAQQEVGDGEGEARARQAAASKARKARERVERLGREHRTYEAELHSIPDKIHRLEVELQQLRTRIGELEQRVAALNRRLADLQDQEAAERRRAGNTRERQESVRRTIEGLRARLDTLRREADSTRREYRERLSSLHDDQRGSLGRMKQAQRAAAQALEAARTASGEVTRLSAGLAAVEQDTTNRFEALESNRTMAGEQSGTIDAQSAAAEIAHARRLRLEQSIELNDHIMLVALDAMYGRLDETERLLRRLDLP